MARYILSIDQGTTSSRAILFDDKGKPSFSSQKEFEQLYPENGWVEHNPEDIWSSVLAVSKDAIKQGLSEGGDIVSIGITNQRETTLIWDKQTGEPIYNAIVWQDRRTSEYCQQLKDQGLEAMVTDKTGLLLDPYFSATKVKWLLDNVDGARERAQRGELAFGTVDTFLLWRLTNGESHKTDATNASRTMLFNIAEQKWDDELLALFDIPKEILPTVYDCSANFGVSNSDVLGIELPIQGMAGDQQAALVGQTCFEPGMVKSTYGTGAFLMLNTGNKIIKSQNKLLTTVAYRLNGETHYALEGSIFVAGAAIQWLRDKLKLIKHASETANMVADLAPEHGVYMVPSFTGLGAPYWNPDARGVICGLTRDSGIEEFVGAALNSVAYQTQDLLTAMKSDGLTPKSVQVDGGMVANDGLLDFLADICNLSVKRPQVVETTALGAAYLAGLQAGVFETIDEVKALWKVDKQFDATMDDELRTQLLSGWQDAVQKANS